MITADGVTLDGFSIKKFSQIPTPDWSGVYIPSGTGITVANNLIDGVGATVPLKTIGIQTLYGGTAGATLEGNIVKNVNMGIYNQGAVLLISKNTIENTAHCAIGVDTSLGTTITGNTIRTSADIGIEVYHAGVVANYNDITGNANFGVCSLGEVGGAASQVDARYNWWGHASGPGLVGPGSGDKVSANVDYDPWLGAKLEGAKTETISAGADTLDAKSEADIYVTKTGGAGTPEVTCAEYASNPQAGFTNEIGKYYDVKVDSAANIDSLILKFYFTSAEIAGRDSSTLRMKYWDGDSWEDCSNQTLHIGVTNGYAGYIETTITLTSSPSLSGLTGKEFGIKGNPAAVVPTLSWWGTMAMIALFGGLLAFMLMQRLTTSSNG